jgi:hypothetical protein
MNVMSKENATGKRSGQRVAGGGGCGPHMQNGKSWRGFLANFHSQMERSKHARDSSPASAARLEEKRKKRGLPSGATRISQ